MNLYDYGARNYDPALGRWMNMDKLSDKYSDKSPYNYSFNDPVNMIDPDGNFVVSAEFARKYPNITRYLKENIKSDVMNSKIIMDALYNNTKEFGHDDRSGNLSKEVLDVVLTFGKGPGIVSKKAPGGLTAANGYYNQQTGNIELNEERLKYLEGVLSSEDGECNTEDKAKALLGGFMLIIHELGHYGDLLDGLNDGGEIGVKIEWDVWWEDHKNYPYTNNTDKFDPNTQQEIIDEKKGAGVLPTIPEHPGSAGPADKKLPKNTLKH